MKQNIIKYLLLLCITITTSCASTTFLTIDVMQPAKIDFAQNIVNVAIVDNAGATIEASTASNSPETIVTSFSKDVFVKSLTQFLGEEQYFNDVVYYPQIVRTDMDYSSEQVLSSSLIREIAKEVDADAVISINTVDFATKKVITQYESFLHSGAQAKLNFTLRIYDSNARPITPIIISEDSITWVGDRQSLPYDIEVIEKLILEMSEGMAKLLAPHWEQQERWYYSDGTAAMKKAKEQAKAGNWEEAAKIWGGAFETVVKEKDKAKIASNIALANENLGDISNAVTWIRIASDLLANHQNSVESGYTQWYKIALLKREQNNPKVLEQMGATAEDAE